MRSGTRFWRALSAAPFTRARLFPAMVEGPESFGLERRSSILPNIREQGPRRSSTAVNDWNAWLRRLALGGSGQRNVYSLNWRQARSTDDRRQPFEGASNGRQACLKGPVPRRIGRTKGGPKPLLLPQTQHRDAAAASCEPTAAAPASLSTEETMSHQLGACDNDRDQHQFPECLRCNFIAHMLSDVLPSTTGNIAAVEIETSSQLNWRLAVRRIA